MIIHPKNNIPIFSESERLIRLHDYEILNSHFEKNFDRIAELAADIFECKFAQINFIDEHLVFSKSNIGLLYTDHLRHNSLCNIAIESDMPTLFENTLENDSLRNLDLIKRDNGIRFYAAAPLKTFDGYKIGTLCVLDVVTKKTTEKQLKRLEKLAAIVMDELNMRLSTRKALKVHNDLVHKVVHDLKNPNTIISLSVELIKKKADDPDIVLNFADRIKNAANKTLENLNNLVQLSTIHDLNFKLNLSEFNVNDLLSQSAKKYFELANQKKQSIIISNNENANIIADKKRLQEAFEIIISNALKYSNENTIVNIDIINDEENITIKFKDEGPGLTDEDIPQLFDKFTVLSAMPTAREYSNGIGLSSAKILVELHKGKIWAENLKNKKGACFYISIPII